MQILLDDDVASACELSVFPGNERGIESGPATWIFRSVNEPKQITLVEIAEAVCLIDGTRPLPRSAP